MQVLFFEQDRDRASNSKAAATHDHHHKHKLLPLMPSQSQSQELFSTGKQTVPTSRELDIHNGHGHGHGKLKLGAADHHDKFTSSRGDHSTRRTNVAGKKDYPLHLQTKRSDGKFPVGTERKIVSSTEIQDQVEHQLETGSGSKLDAKKMIQRGSRSDHGRDKGKDR